ncbi:hypothetical protein SK128_025877, partial [Halocaridina rubra]
MTSVPSEETMPQNKKEITKCNNLLWELEFLATAAGGAYLIEHTERGVGDKVPATGAKSLLVVPDMPGGGPRYRLVLGKEEEDVGIGRASFISKGYLIDGG